MSKIKFTKVTLNEIEALQSQVETYVDTVVYTELKNPGTYFQGLLKSWICKGLWKMFRNKIESDSCKYSIILNPDQAVVLMLVCMYGYANLPAVSYSRNVALSYKDEIDSQLKSLNLIVEPQTQDHV